ncbi:hypothetical protein GQF42_38005 [Streptomyces broussonetiae]|uniref:Uncharacterized protein n=1 Tax=Streptomyces broussonetiae TaxID=2686304 RepID=A0A6I6NH79_9ACTN|nr:hypothetical protein [Streptomyces broussonetiae]QHA08295.1 hypothetical protein GQF42_38005 [Streptomyces broussonetiae]
MRQRWAARGEVLVWWTVLVGVYLMFITPVTALELLVAAGGAAIAAVAARAVRVASGAGVGGTRRWASAALTWPGAVLADLGRLCGVTARAVSGRSPQGSMKTLSLRSGTGAAWACAALSATPGAYVVDVQGQKRQGRQSAVAHFLTEDRTRLEDVLTEGGRR